jgi:peptidoglycan/LPS O-acetylase OafA/YrhL
MASTAVAGRDRYFDTLRAVAIVRVVVFHAFPAAALELVFPSMGVMFALGGSLMVTSIDRSAAQAVRSRIRRLLPALWVMGLVLVPVMLIQGWPDRPSWPRLLLWAFPIADPPSSEFGQPAAGVLWYLVTYLWLVLLSPLLLMLYRRWALGTVLLPLAGLALMTAYPASLGETAGWVVTNVLTFGSCWILGFAHREGALRKLSPAVVAALAVACIGSGLGWAFAHRTEDGAVDLIGIPFAYAVFSMGFVLALLRWQPRMTWLAKVPPLNGFVSLVNNRAVTIYLWHNVAITIAIALDGPLDLWRIHPVFAEEFAVFTLAMVLLLVVIFALGWVEDVAAKRKARLSPLPARTVPRPFEASTETADPSADPSAGPTLRQRAGV